MVGASPRSRFEPPGLDDRHIARPGLLAILQERWRCRAVLLVAGAGAGKTSLLAQAIAENRLQPFGEDRWLSLGPPHNDPGFLVQELWTALRLVGAVPADADGLTEALYGLRAVTAMHLDDLHQLDPQGDGMEVIRRLLRDAPPNLHFVFASRDDPTLPLARLEATGDLSRIPADRFAFTDEEQTELAARWGSSPELLASVGGWPALTALQLGAGVEGPVRFLLEEIVAGLDQHDRDELAVLLAMGRATPTEVEAALGRRSRLSQLAHTIPLLQATDDGTIVPHDLWTEVGAEIESTIEPDEVRVRAAGVLLDLGSVDRAFDLLVESDHPERVIDVVVQTCVSGTIDPRPEMIRSWRQRLPSSLRDHPVSTLLDGMHGVVDNDLGAGVRDSLMRAVEESRAAGLTELELVSVALATWVRMMRAESAEVIPLILRMAEFAAAGHKVADPAVAMAEAVMAQVSDDDDGALAALARIGPTDMAQRWMVVVEGVRVQSLVMLGRLEEALEAAQRSAELSPTGEQGAIAMATFLRGADRELVELMHRVSEQELSVFSNQTVRCFLAVVGAWCGDIDFAAEELERARSALGGAEPPELLAVLAQAETAIALAEGRPGDAAAILKTLTTRSEALAWRVVRRAAGLSYLLLPEWRERLDSEALPEVRAVTRDQAKNLLRLRAGEPVQPDEWAAPPMVLTSLPMRWSAEVAVRRWAKGDEGALALAEHLALTSGDAAWKIVRELATDRDGDAELAAASSAFLAALPVPSKEPVTIRLVGPTEIVVGESVVDAPELRRQRVRQLLALLGLRRSIDRSHVAGLLWPDQDEKSAAANVRTNLRHLLNAIEPDRQAGEASFLVRPSGPRIELAGPAYITTDIELIERAIGEAEDLTAAGAHSQAMLRFEAAVAMWRGRPLDDLAGLADFAGEADRLTTQLVTAAVRAAELRLAHGDAARATDLASSAIAADPWAESARRVAIDAALHDGERALARRLAEQCRTMLADLEVDPEPETEMALRRAS